VRQKTCTVAGPALIAELVDVAGLYVNPCRGDALHDVGPWWMGQPRRRKIETFVAMLKRGETIYPQGRK